MIGPAGYGRYNDDPEYVGCPRAKSDMTPCIARDGAICLATSMVCVACGANPVTLLTKLRHEALGYTGSPVTNPRHAADKLKELVWEVTSPDWKPKK